LPAAGKGPAQALGPSGLTVHWARDVVGRVAYHRDVLAVLHDRPVFVTVDLDGFDPSLVPATGTPEPGGLLWFDVTRLLAMVARHCKVVGADITELAPTPDGIFSRPSEFLAARLAAKMVSYFWAPR